MNNYEILKECKIAWEICNDLKDNCEYINDKERHEIDETMNLLDKVYDRAYNEENKAYNENEYNDTLKPRTSVCCPHCNKEMYISDIIGYAYVCPNCDENMYLGEGDTNYAWWLDDEKDIDCELEDIIDKKIKQLKNELRYVKKRNKVCGTSKRDLAEEDSLLEQIEYYEDILSNI